MEEKEQRKGKNGHKTGSPASTTSAPLTSTAVVIDAALSQELLAALSDAFAPQGPFFANHCYLDADTEAEGCTTLGNEGSGTGTGTGAVDVDANVDVGVGVTSAPAVSTSGSPEVPSQQPRFFSYHDDLRSHPASTIAATAAALLPVLAPLFPQHPQLACPEVCVQH